MHTIARILLVVALWFGFSFGLNVLDSTNSRSDVNASMKQLNPSETGDARAKLEQDHAKRSLLRLVGWGAFTFLSIAILKRDWEPMLKKIGLIALMLCPLTLTGCWRPFEPYQLEKIEPNEEAFLLPYTENVDKQIATNSEDFFKKNMVFTQQVKIPQQWVPVGFEWFGIPNGEWRPAAILLRVDKSPVTREWTADENSGTSNRNEAIWVMTSDQVEFSTGWTCTAKIQSKDDAVKFLYHYRNGSLEKVMDQEIRAKIQTAFGLEVTDRPMDTLRKQATPHILKVVEEVTKFAEERGITITNLGITGGFVYKDPTISQMMVKVFNAEQDKSIAIAETQAQTERNKTIQLSADSKSKAELTLKEAQAKGMLATKQAEADAIKLVADAKSYEMEKAKENSETYMLLKRLEIDKARLEKWDGRFPVYFFGQGSQGLDLLLQTPTPTPEVATPAEFK